MKNSISMPVAMGIQALAKLLPMGLLTGLLIGLPQLVLALGLGAIDVSSYLNEPLEARIPLSGLKANELENLRIGLAGDASFERAGLERTYVLTQLKFSTEALSNGRGYIRIRSRQALREPGLSLIIQVDSSTASFERRYNLLLNLRP